MDAHLAGAVLLAVCLFAPAAHAEPCPPLQSSTVQIECSLDGRPVGCTEAAAQPGTVAVFRCKPLYHFLFDYLPAAGYESRCGESGDWSVQPFRCVPICGQPTGKPTALVRDGEKVQSAADYPWHVTIYDVTLDMAQVCGGSLITTKYFVSAAHCFHDNKNQLPATRYMAAFGRTKRDVKIEEPNVQYKEVEKLHLPKDYGGRRLQYANDIALAELRDEVDVTAWAMPVCMDWGLELPPLLSGEEGTVIGFGDLPERPSEELRFARLPFVRGDVCKKKVVDSLAVFTLIPDKFCVGFVNRTTVAKGDSGGGLSFPNEDRKWFLRGVVSVGSSQQTTFSYFTNVTAFVPWISAIINHGEVSGRRCGVDVHERVAADGQAAAREAFPWEVDVYYKGVTGRDATFNSPVWTGVLVKPNLVIAPTLLYKTEHRNLDLSKYPAQWITVAARVRTADGLPAKRIPVVRSFVPDDVQQQTGVPYNFLLLELEESLNLMPACLDWSGGALLQKRKTGTTVEERRPKYSRTWRRFPILESAECKPLVKHHVHKHNICSGKAEFDPVEPLNSLFVNVDQVWFLRGIWTFSNSSTAMYSDMSDPGVRYWLSKTRDLVGKPSCGEVHLCEPMAAGLALYGSMPWTVAVATNGEAVGTGVLVQPNAVITDSSFVRVAGRTAADNKGAFPSVPPANVSIQWVSENGTAMTSRVVRVSVHENAVLEQWDVALLELDSSTAIFNTPACLDLSGLVPRDLRLGGQGLAETWSYWAPDNHSLHVGSFLPPDDCRRIMDSAGVVHTARTHFCSAMFKDALGPKVQGGGFLMYLAGRWYMQGMYTNSTNLPHTFLSSLGVGVTTDLADDDVRTWLRRKIDKIPLVRSELPATTDAKICVGDSERPSEAHTEEHRPDVVTECGVFVPRNDFGVADGKTDYLDRASSNHMDWNVEVNILRTVWTVYSGILISPRMVITHAAPLMTTDVRNNATGSLQVVPVATVVVRHHAWNSPTPHSAKVRRIHVRERSKAPPGDLAYDVALLELRSTVPLMPVCVPLGAAGAAVPALGPGTKGLVEMRPFATSLTRILVPGVFRTVDECKKLLPNVSAYHIVGDEFCSQFVNVVSEEVVREAYQGAGFAVLAGGRWFLRGVLDYDWSKHKDGAANLYSYCNLDDPELADWLAHKMHGTTPSAGTTAAAPASTSTPPIPVASSTAATANASLVGNKRKPATPLLPTPSAQTPKPPPSEPAKPAATRKCGQATLVLAPNPVTVLGHLPWNVVVNRDNGSAVSAGVLVRHDLVLTDVYAVSNPAAIGSGNSVDVNTLSIVWVSATGTRRQSRVVGAIYEPRRGAAAEGGGLVLLRLRTPFLSSALPCLDLDGPQPYLPPLQPGYLGIMETWPSSGGSPVIVPMEVVPTADCPAGANLCADRFCPSASGVPCPAGEVRGGSALLMDAGGAWYVCGVRAAAGRDGRRGPFAIIDLAGDGARGWLRAAVPQRNDLSTGLYFAE